jgi:hypothetical protein
VAARSSSNFASLVSIACAYAFPSFLPSFIASC